MIAKAETANRNRPNTGWEYLGSAVQDQTRNRYSTAPKSACRPPANLPSTQIRARIIAPVTPSPPSAVLTPSIPVHRWIRAKKPVVRYHDFVYQAQSRDIPRRVVAKEEWHQGELFPRVGFVVTNLNLPPASVTHYYNGRGTAEQWIREGRYALDWTRLSCHRFVANQVRLWLFVLAYNLGNFMRRLTLLESVKHWSLRGVQTKLIKMGGRLVRHARRLVFQLAEVAVSREVFRQVLERIAGLHPAPG